MSKVIPNVKAAANAERSATELAHAVSVAVRELGMSDLCDVDALTSFL